MLILDIFAQRARSSEGRLQVELAQLKYNLPRLVEKDTGLSRLSGGIGGRGPGETKLEIGRRRSRDRIVELERRIEQIGAQRELRRRRRQAGHVPVVAILGYTNVGKSTLFNALTQSDVLAENKLFATLDPAQRRVTLPPPSVVGNYPLHHIVVSDTVGFIRELPEELKFAFRATLEEIGEASVLLHVLDASDPDALSKKLAVERTLEEMEFLDIPQLVVLNKSDAVSPEMVEDLRRTVGGVAVSATRKLGLRELLGAVDTLAFPAGYSVAAVEGGEVPSDPSLG
jgi:GTP-binding protein HflX